MTLIAIILATLAAGIGSVWVAAALLRLGMGTRQRVGPHHLLSLAAGALLATAFMHLLPEAFESQASAHDLFATLLLGLVFFFLLDKAELWHHGHEHSPSERHIHGQGHHDHHPDHAHDHHHGPGQHGHGGWALLTGDSVHCFGDGVLIASAFMADTRLGVVAALSVLAHEVPHHIGDLVVLRHSTRHRNAALLKVSLAGALTALGGLVGYYLVGLWDGGLPYFLAIASSSFVYVALADLIPQLQKRLSAAQTLAQIAWLAAGIAVVTFVSGLAHAH
ncbi:ZIP family metal transporter [Diaphorobacter sp. J5-51]|uniref:ZIP family metal transporter n=1 Tax=Diaphorobacter sp. J5-51 TaxID=680496 RepID=UPI0000DCB9D7|nr:ZIP family metal transporter [Diaphorobacter sp. J5-51]ABM43437.1 zinc/iron permease [Acidovorax sp. JS42]KLR56507.1 dihydroorotate dehydrogenase [Diaphorobacter sp. J5-51]